MPWLRLLLLEGNRMHYPLSLIGNWGICLILRASSHFILFKSLLKEASQHAQVLRKQRWCHYFGAKGSIAQEERLVTSPNWRGGSTYCTQWHNVDVVILSPEMSCLLGLLTQDEATYIARSAQNQCTSLHHNRPSNISEHVLGGK